MGLSEACNIEALIIRIRIGFWCPLYHNKNKEAPILGFSGCKDFKTYLFYGLFPPACTVRLYGLGLWGFGVLTCSGFIE